MLIWILATLIVIKDVGKWIFYKVVVFSLAIYVKIEGIYFLTKKFYIWNYI